MTCFKIDEFWRDISFKCVVENRVRKFFQIGKTKLKKTGVYFDRKVMLIKSFYQICVRIKNYVYPESSFNGA